jgi:hypothetical protein
MRSHAIGQIRNADDATARQIVAEPHAKAAFDLVDADVVRAQR